MSARDESCALTNGKALRFADDEVGNASALAESEETIRGLVDDSAYGVFQASFDGAIHSGNECLLKMLACASLEDLRTLNLARDVFRYPEHYAKLTAACRRQGLVQSADAEWRRKDGAMILIRTHLRYLPLPDGGEALQGIVEDVTETRARERQLQQAQKFEAIGQLAGGIAHDFNNVVGAILGWAELGYEQSRAYPTIAERFTRIRTQAERAAALTQELLAFARRQPMRGQPVDLNAITNNFTSFLDKVIGKDIEVKMIPRPLERVQADAAQVEQVLTNLCLNARDAMPEGGELTIETELATLDESYCRVHPGVAPGQYAVLAVSDTGIGMSAETRERIFEPFFTTKERGKGTGMGLATVYGIVQQHNGFLEVYSEPGEGSQFRVYFPLLRDVAQSVADAKSRVGGAEVRGTETILLAEDHDSIREMVRVALSGFGYRILAAADGAHALTVCEKEAPSLAVLDVVMPRLGGAETAEKLLARFPKIQILFTSGYAERARALEVQIPASHYLQKPYSPTTLARTIRNILAGGEAGTFVRH